MKNAESAMSIGLIGIAWRGIVVGIGYVFLLSLGGAVVAALGAPLPEVEDSSALLPWLLSSGILIGIALGVVARRMPGSLRRHLLVWFCLLFLNSLAVMVEALFFVPEQVTPQSFPYLVLQQLLASVGTAYLVARLFAPRTSAGGVSSFSQRRWQDWLWRIASAVLLYILLFFVIGGLNYALVTRPYYEEQGGLVTPEGPVVLVAEAIRGILIVLSILPFSLTDRTSRRRLMISAGLLLFVAGGAAPLMLQATTLPGFLLLASGWEIFLQLVPTGALAAALLAPEIRPEAG